MYLSVCLFIYLPVLIWFDVVQKKNVVQLEHHSDWVNDAVVVNNGKFRKLCGRGLTSLLYYTGICVHDFSVGGFKIESAAVFAIDYVMCTPDMCIVQCAYATHDQLLPCL